MIPFLRRTSYKCPDIADMASVGISHTHAKKNLLRNFKSLKRKELMKRRRHVRRFGSPIPIRYAVVRYMPLAK